MSIIFVQPGAGGVVDINVADHFDSSMRLVLALKCTTTTSRCFNVSQSPLLGGFNELFVLSFSREWLLQRLDWSCDMMIRV